jgi:NDP-sugar pyrophosphorylase family protein
LLSSFLLSLMEFAIIAAGEGSRLAQEGFKGPKPMVPLQGLPLIHRLINSFINNGAVKIHIIINEYSPQVEEYLHSLNIIVPVNLIKKNTPSSLHSFYELTKLIEGDAVCLATTDTVFKEDEFTRYINAFVNDSSVDALMAATAFVDDEKPLYIETDDNLMVKAYIDEKNDTSELVSGGIYCLRRHVFKIVDEAITNGVSRMRNLQRLLIEKGCAVKAYPFSKIIDIDHVEDIAKAQQWLDENCIPTAL